MANCHRKTVDTASCLQVHILYRLTRMEKELANKSPYIVQPAVEAAFTIN
jgi:hypothetical protein